MEGMVDYIQTGRVSGAASVEKAMGRSYFRHLILASTAFAAVALMAPDAYAAPAGTCNITTTMNTSALVSPIVSCTFKGGTLTVDGAGSTSDTFTLGSGGGTIDQKALSYTFNGIFSGASSNAITFANSGSAGVGGITLSAVNTYSGATTINAGAVLLLSGLGGIASSSGVANNGTLDISATSSGATINALTGAGGVSLGGNLLTVNNTGTSIFSGSIADGGINPATGGALSLTGSGTETLTGVSTYTGATSISKNSTLALSGSGSIANSSGVADLNVFDITGVSNVANTASIESLSSTAGHAGVVNLGTNTLVLTNAADNFHGAINGSGGLTVSGGTGETLSGASSYTGTTTIGANGKLTFSAAGSNTTTDVFDSGTLSLNNQTLQSLTTYSGAAGIGIGVSTITLTNAGAVNSSIASQFGEGAAGKLVLSGGTTTITSTGSFYDTGGLTIQSPATMVLDGLTRSSVTVLQGAQLSGAGTIGSVLGTNLTNSGTVTPGDATLNPGGGNTLHVDGAFTNNPTGTFQINVAAITDPVGPATPLTAYGTYGNLAAAGLVTLGGTFDLQTVQGFDLYSLTAGETTLYDVLSFGTLAPGSDFSGLMYDGTACTAESADLYACGAHITIAEDFLTNSGQLNLDITVPEPSSWAMLGSALVGLLGFGLLRRRRA
jgi:autotransporter-associated beta strand protein